MDRYEVWHEDGSVQFYLENLTLNIQEAKYILLKVVEQAIRDYTSPRLLADPKGIEYWKTARGFLFDPDYTISWGSMELDIETISDILDLDLDWIRRRTKKRALKRGINSDD